MNIDCYNFRSQLPVIVQAISRSYFVSFDLELSGIPSRQHNRPRSGEQDDGGKQTLQQRYMETKAAAERFQPEPSFLNIAPVGHGEADYNGRGLNGYQKRLVHQLVRAEYPDLVSISKSDFVQIVEYNTDREEAQLRRKRQGLENNLTSQIGLRWVIQAMCSNIEAIISEDHIIPMSTSADFQATLKPQSFPINEDYPTECLNYLLSRVKRTILVGHNLFLDLIYLYACFFGPLPDQLEEFQAIIGTLFPMIIDTKYLADIINQNSPRYRSSLEDIDEELSKIPSPAIELPPEYSKYASSSPMHEAGFDSFLTAKVHIRLSAKISGRYESMSLGESKTQEPAQQSLSQVQMTYNPQQDKPSEVTENLVEPMIQPSASQPLCSRPPSVAECPLEDFSQTYQVHEQMRLHSQSNPVDTDFVPSTGLESAPWGTASNPEPQMGATAPSLDSHNMFGCLSAEEPTTPVGELRESSPRLETRLIMPPADSSFWAKYGNKLRVNGTVEEVCILDQRLSKSGSNDSLSRMQPPGYWVP
ncbi:MAG: hypothetical protein Q9217_000870 [Psora testacea]